MQPSRPSVGMEHRPLDRKSTILLVDDESTLRCIFSDMMTGDGYRCITAANALDALQIIESNLLQFDMLVTDIKMPGGLDGVGLANKMRELQPDVAILVITGYPECEAMKEAKAKGYRVLEKPFRHFDLEAAVAEQLAKRAAHSIGGSVTSIEQARKSRQR